MSSIFNTYGCTDPVQIELEVLQAKLDEARRAGDLAQCAIISENLRAFRRLKAA